MIINSNTWAPSDVNCLLLAARMANNKQPATTTSIWGKTMPSSNLAHCSLPLEECQESHLSPSTPAAKDIMDAAKQQLTLPLKPIICCFTYG